jgi:mRNA interferase RelE/StbE
LIWTIKVSSHAERYFKKLDKKFRQRLRKELLVLGDCENPMDHKDVKPLTGDLRGFYRLRIGRYRVIFSVLKEQKIIAVGKYCAQGGCLLSKRSARCP